MILHHTKEEVRRYDLVKLIIALVLVAVLIIMLLTGNAVNRTAVSNTAAPEAALEAENAGIELSAPALNAPAAGLTSGDITFSGTGEPGTDVAVLVNGEVVGIATVGSDGTWSLATELTAGDYTVSAQTLDADGNIAAESEGLSVTVANALQLPTIDLPTAGLMAGAVALTGTGTSGSTIELFADGTLIGTTSVGEDGTWVFDAELDGGEYALSARAIDAAGNETAVSDPLSLSLTPAFVAPTLTLPEGELTAGTVSLTGTGTPGATMEIVVDGEVAGTTLVGDDGRWSLDVALPDGGEYALSARTLDADGQLVAESDAYSLSLAAGIPDIAVPTLNLPEGGLSAGALTLAGTGEPGTEIEVVVDGTVVGTTSVAADGSWSFDLDLPGGEYDVAIRALDANGQVVATSESQLNVAAAELAAPAISQPEDGATLQAGELLLSGTGDPGAEIEILDNGAVVGTAVVGDDGNWQFSFTPDAGNHEYAVRNLGAETAVSTIMTTIMAPVVTDSAVVICGNPAPGIDQGATYIVGECEWLVRIASRLGIAYRDLIAVNPDIENPNIIYPGQVINLPVR